MKELTPEQISKLPERVTKLNTQWKLTIQSPLLRPGMTLEVGPVSEKYIVQEAKKALEKVRDINS